MPIRKRKAAALSRVVALAFVLACACVVRAQEGEAASSPAPRAQAAKRDETNLEVQLHLLLASNAEGTRADVPRELEGVVRQLKSSLALAHYRQVATFFQRVKDGGGFDVKSVGPSPLAGAQPQVTSLTYHSFRTSGVRLVEDAAGQRHVQLPRFSYGLRVPIQTGTVRGEEGGPGLPVVNYEDMGINTELSVREGEPTVVGTLNTRRPEESFILIVTVRRAGR